MVQGRRLCGGLRTWSWLRFVIFPAGLTVKTITLKVAEADHGFLYDGDCYVILYSYGDSGHIVYFWQGSHCSIDERGASAIHAARIDNEELGGSAMQVRVVQGLEPRHFIKMFGGNLVVLKGH